MGLADARLRLIDNFADCEDLLSWLGERRNWLTFDIETTGLHLGRDRVRLCQFGDESVGWALDWERWKGVCEEVVRRVKEDPSAVGQGLTGHNILFDTRFLKRDGIDIPQAMLQDTMIMCHLVDSLSTKGLKPAAGRWVDRAAWLGKDALSQTFKNTGWSWGDVPADHPAYWTYSAMDCVLTAHLAEKLWPKVVELGSERIYEIEIACIAVLRDAELRGMRVDLDYCRKTLAALEEEMAGLQKWLARCGIENVDADAQVRDALIRWGAVLTKTTPRGQKLAVDDEVLADVETQGEDLGNMARTIRRARLVSKLIKSYFKKFLAAEVDGIIYPSINPVAAKTGRMSVTDPALQTLPRGDIVRNAFIAREGCKLISADFQQVEYRVLACKAQDQNMLKAFRDFDQGTGPDLHTYTAMLAYGIEDAEVTPPQRQICKSGSFSKLYGAGEEKFAKTAGITPIAAANFFVRYDQVFPGVAGFMQRTINDVVSKSQNGTPRKGCGWVTTTLGRRLYVEADKAYTGVNFDIQSSATADVLKKKICELDACGLGDTILLPVHDEVLFEVPDEAVEDVVEQIHEVMPETHLFELPLTIDVNVSDSWGAMK